MQVTILQHTPYEDAGYAEVRLRQHQATLNRVMVADPAAVYPTPEQSDMLVICGGPQSAGEEDQYPWLKEEKAYIRAVIDSGRPVLGLCLGGQLIAAALGGAVSRNPQPEIGWFTLQGLDAGEGTFRFPPQFEVMEWHYDTFSLPAGAVRLASSPACANQAYQLGERVIGLQCHPEMTAENIRYLLTHFPQELKPLTGIQSAAEIDAGIARHAAQANQLMADIVDYLLPAES